jgi:hypothetical protein
MTQAESWRRRTALTKGLEMGHLGQPTLSEAARYAGVRHGSIQHWLKSDPDVAAAWQRAQGGFRLDERPELPDFPTFREWYFGHQTPEHQRAWLVARTSMPQALQSSTQVPSSRSRSAFTLSSSSRTCFAAMVTG